MYNVHVTVQCTLLCTVQATGQRFKNIFVGLKKFTLFGKVDAVLNPVIPYG